MVGVSAIAQNPSAPQPRRGSAENSLVGIALYDPGTRVIARFGNPDDIQGLSTGAGGAAPGGAPSGPGGGRGGPGAGGGGGQPTAMENITPSGAGTAASDLIGDPFSEPSSMWRQAFPEDEGDARGRGAPPTRGGPPGGMPSGPGRPGGPGGRPGGADGTVSGSSGRVIFTRWVYRRPGTRYAFVMDKFNRVIQIEAIGMRNSAVRTRRGVTLGTTFGTLIRQYGAPDAYEITGDNIVVRFLVRDRVAFRMSRLQANKPHQVTGVVVAAGKQ